MQRSHTSTEERSHAASSLILSGDHLTLFEDRNPLQVKGEDEIRTRAQVGAEMGLKVASPERRLTEPQKNIFYYFVQCVTKSLWDCGPYSVHCPSPR
jgi:hypothetical protein